MNRNILFIFIIFAIVVAGAYFVFLYKPGANETLTKDASFVILNDLKKQTKMGFSDISGKTFSWNIESEDAIGSTAVPGKGFGASGISNDDADKIRQYFEDDGFKIDFFNAGNGTLSGISGYRKGSDVCVIETTAEDNAPDKLNVNVSCGELTE